MKNPFLHDKTIELVVQHLERIEKKVDKLDERLDSSEKVAIKQEANLEAHMKRGDLLEMSQEDLKNAVKPIIKTYTIVWGISKMVVGIGVISGILATIAKMIKII